VRERRRILPHKNNMLRNDNVVGGEIETPIAFVIREVSKENTSGGPRY
jgi:hypothetical protein